MFETRRMLCSLCALLLSAGAAGQHSSTESQPERTKVPRMRYLLDTDGILTFESGLDDSSGSVSVQRAGARFRFTTPSPPGGVLNVSIGTEHSVYDFDDVSTLAPGTPDPIDGVYTVGLSSTYLHKFDERWFGLIGGRASAWGEYDSQFNDSLTWAAHVGARYSLTEGLWIAVGVGASERLEANPLVLPVFVVDWKINDRWRLSTDGNELGPLSYLGVLSYKLDDELTLRLDAGWEYREYRLASTNAIPDGVLRDIRYPVALGAIWTPARGIKIQTKVGLYAYQQFETLDGVGNTIADDRTEPAPFLSLLVRIDF